MSCSHKSLMHLKCSICRQSYVDTDVGANFMTAPAGGRTREAPSYSSRRRAVHQLKPETDFLIGETLRELVQGYVWLKDTTPPTLIYVTSEAEMACFATIS